MAVYNGIFPILPGKEDEARAFAKETMGARRSEYDAFQKESDVTRETWSILALPDGSSVTVVWFECPDIEKAFANAAQDASEFAVWFRGRVMDITHPVRAIGTSALRDAEDGPEFCDRVRKDLKLSIEVISANEEARLAFLSVARAFDITGRKVAVADIGGGSTEIVLASSGLVDQVYETKLGAVRDGGVGIKRATVERIFEPFYTSDDAQGSGLGLAIARELAERMNGRLSVDSVPGRTTFTLDLPA